MELTPEQIHGLGIALNEATLLGIEVNKERRIVVVAFVVHMLPKQASSPQEAQVLFVFSSVERVAASLRLGRWDDLKAEVVKFPVGELLTVVQSFGGLPIYGWNFFDVHDEDFPRWSNRLSFDWRYGALDSKHSLTVFQEGKEKHLDVCLWFDSFVIKDAQGQNLPLEKFIAGGRRWWDGLFNRDHRTDGQGIFPVSVDRND